MSETNILWHQALAAFAPHQLRGIDHTPQMALDRVAVKCLRISLKLFFNSSNCNISQTLLPFSELDKLTRYDKLDANPHCECEPIVVLVYNGQRYVIDGRRRVTKWLNEDSTKPRLALIIEPRPLAS